MRAGRHDLDLQINLEAFLAGIDLDAVSDTDEAEQAEATTPCVPCPGRDCSADAPRLLSSVERPAAAARGWRSGAAGRAGFDSAEDVDLDLPRMSDGTLVRQGAPARRSCSSWPDGAGALVLRQQGVEDPFTGYLDGGDTSAAISLQVAVR